MRIISYHVSWAARTMPCRCGMLISHEKSACNGAFFTSLLLILLQCHSVSPMLDEIKWMRNSKRRYMMLYVSVIKEIMRRK